MAQSALVGAYVPTLAVVDGIPTTTSIDVARAFGKPHADVLRTVRNLLPQLSSEHARNFAEMFVETDIGQGGVRKDPAYRLTRDGFTLLAMGFTGKKALQFKLAYIDAFNRMEAQLSTGADPERIKRAYALASEVAVQAARTVFQAVMAGDDGWKNERWMFALNYGRDTVAPWAGVIDRDAMVASLKQLAAQIVEPDEMLPSNTDLANLAAACNQRLAQRMEYAANQQNGRRKVFPK